MIRYDDHAEFQLARRDIDKAAVEETIRNPDTTETEDHRLSYLKCLPGRHVVTRCSPGERSGVCHHRLFRQDETMRVRVDHSADAVYVNLTDRAIKDSAQVADGIIVDYDDAGRIVGVEILDASKRTEDPEALRQFSLDIPTVG